MDKCIRQLPPLRVTEQLETDLMRLAAKDERTLSEYMKLALMHHVYGHAGSIGARPTNDNSGGHGNA